jgi:adenylylsulfate kinase
MRPVPGYGDEARDAFYETLARLASLCASQSLITLVPATANRRAYRERARLLGQPFLEVFVDTPLEECVRRDPKGLYARAADDDSSTLPGSHMVYEPPEHPDLVTRPTLEGAVEAIVALVVEVMSAHATNP